MTKNDAKAAAAKPCAHDTAAAKGATLTEVIFENGKPVGSVMLSGDAQPEDSAHG